jgi:hypothetical protein
MNTFRALCAELLQPLAEYDGANPYHEHRDLITRARAELAKSEPEGPEAGELSPREVEAQGAFTEMRDEILSRSDGLGVNEVLSVIDSFTPDWV